MADRRMFAKSIVLSDAFTDMPMSARCLYFTLGMFADDDGFVGSPKSIMRQCGASEDDMKVLIAKKFIIKFETGVIVIKHWRMNNYLRADRHHSTTYLEEYNTLGIDDKGAYTQNVDKMKRLPNGIPTDNQVVDGRYTEVRLGKDRLGKDSIGKKESGFKKPSLEEVKAYCEERNNGIDADGFISFYESKGWMIGKNRMKDWKAAVRTWEKRKKNQSTNKIDWSKV